MNNEDRVTPEEHVIWVVMRCGHHAATVACWRHDQVAAEAVARGLMATKPPEVVMYFVVPCSDVPDETKPQIVEAQLVEAQLVEAQLAAKKRREAGFQRLLELGKKSTVP